MSRQRSWLHAVSVWAWGVVVVFVVVSTAGSATPTSGLEKIRTRFYRLHTDLPTEEARDLAGFLDQMFLSYARVFRHTEHRKAPLDVYVFRTRQRFMAYAEDEGLGHISGALRGFFSPELHAMASYGSGDELRRVLAHEGTHQFITLVTKPTHQPPLWFHEGLATYFETATWEDGKLTKGVLNRERLASLSLMRSDGHFKPVIRLRDLLLAEQPQFSPLHYAEAWSFVYFLFHAYDGKNADVLNRYFILIQQREDPVEAFSKAFRARLSKVEEAWCEYVDQLLKEESLPEAGGTAGSTQAPG